MKGIYATVFGAIFKYYVYFSLNWWLKSFHRTCGAKKYRGRPPKAEPWVSECYEIGVVILLGLPLLFTDFFSDILASIGFPISVLVWVALYRPIEILFFYLNWAFVDGES